jgi:hypothetical protein
VQGIADVDLREDEARVRYRHVELNGPENGNGIQITLYDDNASITIPYWHQPEAPARARAFPTDPRPVRKDGRRATNNRKEAGKDLRLMTVHVSVRSISALLLPGIVLTPEIPLSELQKYVGHYREAAGAAEFTVLVPEPAPRGPAAEQRLVRSPSARRHHPAVLFGDWRKYYDTVRVVRAGELAGRKVYGVQLESAGLSPMRVTLDAETGDVLQTQQAMWIPEAGAIPMTTTYSDYREVGGMRVPHSYIESTEIGGRMKSQVERVEVGVELAPDTFALQPSTESGQRR